MWLKKIKEATHGKKQDCDCNIPGCDCNGSPVQYKELIEKEKQEKDQYAEGAPDLSNIGGDFAQIGELSSPSKLLDFMPIKVKNKQKIKTGKVKDSDVSIGGGGTDEIMGAANKWAGRFS
tara:strand:+ start:422 stop:781 length:360 start_codon:yes stop_codon:yes gene_type:complete